MIKSIMRKLEMLYSDAHVFDALHTYPRFVYHHTRLPRQRDFSSELMFQKLDLQYMSRPDVCETSDKFLVKAYISNRIGAEHVLPTLNISRTVEEAASFQVAASAIAKPTHKSGIVKFLSEGERLCENWCEQALSSDFFQKSRERNYKDLEPKIIFEPLAFGNKNVKDFKIFCNNGEPRFTQVDFDRMSKHSRMFYDLNWASLGISSGYPLAAYDEPRPEPYQAMIEAASCLSKDFRICRVDFYVNNKNFYVGEITHCHGGSFEKIIPTERRADLNKVFFG